MTFREFFRVMFCMLRARIPLLFEVFAGGFPRPCAVRNMFFMDSKGDVSRVFQACVLHASSTNFAAVRGFRRRFSKAMRRERHVFYGFQSRRSESVSGLWKGDVPRVFQGCVLHASGTNPAAVRDFRRRFSKAMCRERHVFYGFQR